MVMLMVAPASPTLRGPAPATHPRDTRHSVASLALSHSHSQALFHSHYHPPRGDRPAMAPTSEAVMAAARSCDSLKEGIDDAVAVALREPLLLPVAVDGPDAHSKQLVPKDVERQAVGTTRVLTVVGDDP